jgi:steroid delta-isomerase-like uncharacterized protein
VNHKELMSGIAEAYSTGDASKLRSLFAQNCYFEDVATGHVSRGIESVVQYCEPFFSHWPDLSLEVVSQVADEDVGAQEWIMSATHANEVFGVPPTGKKFRVRGVSYYQFEKGAIIRSSDYFDIKTLIAQIAP